MQRKRKQNKDWAIDEEFKLTMKAARRTLEVPIPAAMPCKIRSRAVVKPTAILGNAGQNMPVLLVPCETKARRSSAQTSPRSDHWKKDEFSESLQSCSQIHSDASSNENSWCKGNSGKIMGRLEKIPAWQLTKVRNMKEVIDESRNEGRKVHFASLTSRAPRWRCKRWFWFVCSVHWTRIISISNDSRKSSHGHYIKASRMFLTSSRCSIHLYSGQNGRCIKDIQNSKVRMSRYWIRLPSTNGQNHGPAWKTQSFLGKESVRVTLCKDYCGKYHLRKFYWKTVGKKFQIVNVYSVTQKDNSYLCMWTK